MGLTSDIPPPTTSCLKRCRSEDPPSFADLCSPPLKQHITCNSSHHLSLLQDLESSLNAVPTIEATPAPEELVTEMMQSLEKVMEDLEGLIAGSSDSYSYAISPELCLGNSLQADEMSAYDEPFSSIGSVHTPSTSSSDALNLCRDTAADCEESELACEKATLDGCRGMASNCDLVSAFGVCTGDGSDGEAARVATSCAEGCVRDGCTGRDCTVHVLRECDDELGFTDGVPSALATEQSDERWPDLVDELTDGFALSAMPSNWLEEGCELPAFALSQIEEEGLFSVARDGGTELLLLDC